MCCDVSGRSLAKCSTHPPGSVERVVVSMRLAGQAGCTNLDDILDRCVSVWPLSVQREGKLTLLDRVDGVGLGVGDLNGKLLLDGHDDLDGVERVEAEVGGERGSGGELV